MAREYLSKSTFIKGVQCEKALYLHKFNSELADEISQQQEAVFQTGTNVGILAQELFPGGIDASPKDYTKYFESFKYTQQLINEGAEVIYEAGFCFDYVMCFIDVLVKKDGKWHAYEVKSSTKVSETYIIDADYRTQERKYILKLCTEKKGNRIKSNTRNISYTTKKGSLAKTTKLILQSK